MSRGISNNNMRVKSSTRDGIAAATHLHGACIAVITACLRTLPSKTAPVASTLLILASEKSQEAA
jgi:hypothetical protein